ncbi:MAG: macrolide transporter permease [Ferruginibacter sp.]|nr:macrolide transporter permease [Ferruginibacter sp.]
MFKNYLRLSFRNLIKNRTFALINIFGLAIGLTCCMLISMYLFKEFSYDEHQQLGDRLYQVGTISIEQGKENRYSATPAPLVPTMQQDFPEIENSTRLLKLFQDDKTLLQYQDGKELRSFYETNGYMADSTFFRMFTYDFKEGNGAIALDEPNSVVISDEMEKKIFGKEPALNKTIHINSNTNGAFDFKVTGVFIPSENPSHIDARFFLSMQSGEVGQWVRSISDFVNNNMFYSYLLLKPGTDPKRLASKFDAFVAKYAGVDLKAQGRNRKQFIIPVKDIHLYANTEGNVTPAGNLNYLYILISIAVVTLLIACVNFMNLSTARSSKRAVEIGVRKVLGAEKSSLIKQFLGEAILLSVISFVVSIVLALLLTPLFETLSGKEYFFSTKQYLHLGLSFSVLTLVVGLLAGLYTAFYLSAFIPIKVLKGKFSNSLAAISFRKVLVVFQFVVSVALIVASITISNQMHYMQSKDLGFQKTEQIIIPLRTTTAKHIYPALKNSLLSNTSIASAGASDYYPGIENVTDWLLYKQGNAPTDTKTVFMNHVDNSYLQTLGFRVVAGRLFSKDFPGDTANAIVLNEQAVKNFGFASASDAIGKNIAASRGDHEMYLPVIGVVKDFHFKGLHSKIESYGFLLNRRPNYGYLIAHAKGGDIKSTMSGISSQWSKLNPNEPFEYSFLDQDFRKNYVAEERLSAIIRYFTIIAIFISCLGLFGLTTFSVEQRIKEIGIRKVLGAGTVRIVSLLSADFLKLVVISFLVASPLAWYFINKWLEDFAYRAPFTIWIVLSGCGVALLIAFLTISIQAIKAAVANPVKSLRTE